MSLITDEQASRARLRQIQRLTPAIQKARVRKNARRQEGRALSLQWIGTNPGVGYAACRSCGLLAPLGHDVIADLLAFHEGAHAGAFDRADVHEHVPAAVARLDESKALLGIEELHGTCGHHGLLALQLVSVSDHASIAWPVIQFWGSWLGTVKRERREADRKLVAGCYLCDRGRNVNPDASIRRRPLNWVIVALVEALNGIAVKGFSSGFLRPYVKWGVDADRWARRRKQLQILRHSLRSDGGVSRNQ